MSGSESGAQSKRGVWLIGASLLVLALLGFRTIGHASFWLRLSQGRLIAEQGIVARDVLTFTAADRPWVNAYWLYDRILYALWNLGGAPLITIVHVAIVLAAFVVLLPRVRAWAGPTATAVALLICAWLLAARFVVSPALPGLLLAALYIRRLSAPVSLRSMLSLLPLQALWANVHSSFLLGPVLVLLRAADVWYSERESGRRAAIGWLVGILALSLLVSLVNPWGWRVYPQAIQNWRYVISPILHEWISPFSLQFETVLWVKHAVTVALVVGALGLLTEKRKLPVLETALAMVGAFLAVRSLAHAGLLAVLAFPFLALSLSAIGTWCRDRWQGWAGTPATWWPGVSVLALFLLVLVSIFLTVSNELYAGMGSGSRFGLGVENDLFPARAAELLSRPDAPSRTFNLIHDGGYLTFRAPQRRVFLDQRADLYDASLLDTYVKAVAGRAEAWEELVKRWDLDSAVLNACLPGAAELLRTILRSGNWSLAYFDGVSCVVVRSDHKWAQGGLDREIQAEGLQTLERENRAYCEHLASSWRPRTSPRLIGAAAVFLALGRYEEAAYTYDLIVRGMPQMIGAWHNLGLARLGLRDSRGAIEAFGRVTQLQPRFAGAWLNLGRAYRMANMNAEAEAAFAKARQLDPRALETLPSP